MLLVMLIIQPFVIHSLPNAWFRIVAIRACSEFRGAIIEVRNRSTVRRACVLAVTYTNKISYFDDRIWFDDIEGGKWGVYLIQRDFLSWKVPEDRFQYRQDGFSSLEP